MGEGNIKNGATESLWSRSMAACLLLIAVGVAGFVGLESGRQSLTSHRFQAPQLVVGSYEQHAEEEGSPEPRLDCEQQAEEEGPPEPRLDNLFYLKTHKTGSTTIAAALKRYTLRHNMTTVRAPGNIYITKNNTAPDRWDAMVVHHAGFNRQTLSTYLHGEPEVVFTSIRLPLQRQLSWFRQQNNKFLDVLDYDGDSEECLNRKDEVLKYFDEWAVNGKSASQMSTIVESSARARIKYNVTAILDQFDFVFLRERMKESFECLCKKMAVRLCDIPMDNKNAKRSKSCAERLLLENRSSELMRGSEMDLILYERVHSQIAQCQEDLPAYCRCE